MSRLIVLMCAGQKADDHHLSEDEKRKVKSTTEKMMGAGIEPDLILTSFATEAVDSGDIIAETFRKSGRPVTVRPSVYLDRGDILYSLDTLRKENTVIVLSHPHPLRDVSEKLTGDPFVRAEFAQAKIIQCDENPRAGGSEYLWPEVLRFNRHRSIETISP